MNRSQSSYVGHHADLYDLFYAKKPYAEETQFVHHCIQRANPKSKKILELACGTGTHSLLLEKYGYQITATDYSADMLARAREKAESQNSKVEFLLQDMRNLDMPNQAFDAIICLFDSIGYVETNENISRVFQNVREHLKPGGVFIFEFWHAGAMLKHYDPLRVLRLRVPHGEILRISETVIDYAKQLCHVTYSIYELNDDGKYSFLSETQTNRFFLVQEMSQFLINCGLSPVEWFAGFDLGKKINDETWHVLAVASRTES